MKLLRRCDHALQAAHYANLLQAAGIRCELRNTTLSGAIGDIPFLECAPQLWISNALDEARARQVLQDADRPVAGEGWRCRCGEWLEPQFGSCWHCGESRAER